MTVFILMASIWGGNPFYGVDYVPSMEFRTKQQCEAVVAEIKSKQEQSKAYCFEFTKGAK